MQGPGPGRRLVPEAAQEKHSFYLSFVIRKMGLVEGMRMVLCTRSGSVPGATGLPAGGLTEEGHPLSF